jgi:OTU domain-containing protein 5
MRIEPGMPLPTSSYGGAASSSNAHLARGRFSDNINEAVNSDDEQDCGQTMDVEAQAVAERRFEQRLAQRGFEINRVASDGNCLFRSVADRVYGDAEVRGFFFRSSIHSSSSPFRTRLPSPLLTKYVTRPARVPPTACLLARPPQMHDVVRRLCLDHIEKERDHFSAYITQDFDAYVARKRRERVFGNHVEIQAISEIYNRPVHVYDLHGDGEEPMNIYASATEGSGAGAPLRLSYHGRSHYNALFDPAQPDVGEGLGLPGLEPGLADRMQIEQANRESEASALESQLLLQVQGQSMEEMDQTQEAILQAVLKRSLADMTGESSDPDACGACEAAYEPGGVKVQLMAAAALTGGDAAGGSGSVGAGTAASEGGGLATATTDSAILPHGGAVLGESVQTLLGMGFPLPRAVEAHAHFGDDLDSCLEFLTGDQ